MQTILLQNDQMQVRISPLGAELKSAKCGDTEYLWQGNELWDGTAPVLFPICGRLLDGQYTLGGQTYKMDIHGFANTQTFAVESQTDTEATFLLCGYRIKEDGETAQQIFKAGHEIGLHGYSHKSMGKMSKEEIAGELRQTAKLLPEGCEPVFFRAPGGQVTPSVKAAAKEAGLSILNWSVDPRDWATRDATAVVQAVVTDVADGDVILLHDMCGSSVEAALAIVDALLQRGFQFVTASELAELRDTNPQPGLVYTRFR